MAAKEYRNQTQLKSTLKAVFEGKDGYSERMEALERSYKKMCIVSYSLSTQSSCFKIKGLFPLHKLSNIICVRSNIFAVTV